MKNFALQISQELQQHISRLYVKKADVDAKRPFALSSLYRIREEMAIEWTYNSNSIEGNTLTLGETKLVMQDGLTIGGKTLIEHFEVKNHEKAIEYLYSIVNKNYVLRAIDILNIHGLVIKNIDDEFAGRIRNGGVKITGANFVPPNYAKVPDLLDELIEFVNVNPLGLNEIEVATVFHHKLVWIHPFFDGNGRTARLAMNLLLMKAGFPPAIILRNDRKKYYDALQQANNGNYNKLGLLMAQATERSLNIYLSIAPNSSYNFDDIANVVNDDDVVYGQEYISLLARQGKISAHKEGRKWVTTKEAINEYVATRKRKTKAKPAN